MVSGKKQIFTDEERKERARQASKVYYYNTQKEKNRKMTEEEIGKRREYNLKLYHDKKERDKQYLKKLENICEIYILEQNMPRKF